MKDLFNWIRLNLILTKLNKLKPVSLTMNSFELKTLVKYLISQRKNGLFNYDATFPEINKVQMKLMYRVNNISFKDYKKLDITFKKKETPTECKIYHLDDYRKKVVNK